MKYAGKSGKAEIIAACHTRVIRWSHTGGKLDSTSRQNGYSATMYKSDKRLLILDADGTTIDAFSAIQQAF